MPFELRLDCRHYLGDRPCRFKCRCRCEHFEPMGTRVLVIKLGAMGDVVRTACVLPALKRAYDPVHITWISESGGAAILATHPMIDRMVTFDTGGVAEVTGQHFDLVLSLDKEPPSAALCNQMLADEKRGMGLSPWGTVYPVNPECRPYFELGLDDDLKFHHNTKSYPQLICEAAGLPYQREPYRLYGDDAATAKAQALFKPWRQDGKPVVGVNTGAGRVFANKTFGPDKWVEVCRRLLAEGSVVALLGGNDETSHNAWIIDQLGDGAHMASNGYTEQEFVAMVDQCDVVITGDTLALHVAVARGVPLVTLFGPTCPQEIDLFETGEKIISPVDCSPCYLRRCDKDPNCMDQISIDDVVGAVSRVLQTHPKRSPIT